MSRCAAGTNLPGVSVKWPLHASAGYDKPNMCSGTRRIAAQNKFRLTYGFSGYHTQQAHTGQEVVAEQI